MTTRFAELLEMLLEKKIHILSLLEKKIHILSKKIHIKYLNTN